MVLKIEALDIFCFVTLTISECPHCFNKKKLEKEYKNRRDQTAGKITLGILQMCHNEYTHDKKE